MKLTVDGKSYTQPIVVKQDPRVKTPALAMQQVYALTSAMYYGAAEARIAAAKLGAVRQQMAKLQAQGAVAQALAAFDKKAAALEGTPPAAGGGRGGRGGGPAGGGRGGPPAATATDTLWAVSASLGAVMNAMQAADVAPTANTLAAVTAAAAECRSRHGALDRAQDRGSARAERAAQGCRSDAVDG